MDAACEHMGRQSLVEVPQGDLEDTSLTLDDKLTVMTDHVVAILVAVISATATVTGKRAFWCLTYVSSVDNSRLLNVRRTYCQSGVRNS